MKLIQIDRESEDVELHCPDGNWSNTSNPSELSLETKQKVFIKQYKYVVYSFYTKNTQRTKIYWLLSVTI